jgi:hypothetical protein
MNQNELREYLFQKDLAQQKEMDKLIKDAQPKKVNDDYKLKLYKTPIITRDLIGPEYVAEKQLMDLSLDLQLQNMVKQATQNNMEPMAFSFGSGGGFGDIVSDQYSFLDQDSESLKAAGNGGLRQMHNYVDINYCDSVTNNTGEDKKASRMPQGLTVEQLQQQRDAEMKRINGNRPPAF